jgi:hypothetical protein
MAIRYWHQFISRNQSPSSAIARFPEWNARQEAPTIIFASNVPSGRASINRTSKKLAK